MTVFPVILLVLIATVPILIIVVIVAVVIVAVVIVHDAGPATPSEDVAGGIAVPVFSLAVVIPVVAIIIIISVVLVIIVLFVVILVRTAQGCDKPRHGRIDVEDRHRDGVGHAEISASRLVDLLRNLAQNLLERLRRRGREVLASGFVRDLFHANPAEILGDERPIVNTRIPRSFAS